MTPRRILLLAVLLIAAAPPPPTLQRISVGAAEGDVDLGIAAARSLLMPGKDITRIVVLLPEPGAEAFASMTTLQTAAGPGTLVLAPDLAPPAAAGEQVLRWSGDSWVGGGPAESPAPASLFTALDSLAAWLTDPGLFPNLTTIVLAGRGKAGEAVARYAAIGRLAPGIAARHIDFRWVVADPPGCAAVEGAAAIDADLAYRLGETPDGVDATYGKRDVRYLIHGTPANACPALAPRRTGKGKEVHILSDAADALLSPCGRSLVLGIGDCPAEASPPPPPPSPGPEAASPSIPAPTQAAEAPPPPAEGSTLPAEHTGDVLDLDDPIARVLTKPDTPAHR